MRPLVPPPEVLTKLAKLLGLFMEARFRDAALIARDPVLVVWLDAMRALHLAPAPQHVIDCTCVTCIAKLDYMFAQKHAAFIDSKTSIEQSK